jgi:NADH:ubiquinone oxidoreductase subunit C
MDQDKINIFASRLLEKLGDKFTMHSEIDQKGVIFIWCQLDNASDITKVAELVADMSGRIMTISALITKRNEKDEHVEISYHFYFEKVNCTVSISLSSDLREVTSITPILKSADWHEREMQEFYNIKLLGHPNPKRLFLDYNTKLEDSTMIPLSSAMNGTSTSTLWERVMKSSSREVKANE